MPATHSPLNAQDVYAFWIAGFIALTAVVAWWMRHPPPPPKLPRPTRSQLSTMLAWLIIAGIVVVVLLTHRK
jgi:predicted MFS family arabinose efflux permease